MSASHSKLLRILIADDHTVVREGLGAIITIQPDMVLVGEAADGLEAMAQAQALQPDVVLLDLVMPHQDGLAAIIQIKQHNPKVGILVLTSFADDEKVFPAIKAGAMGYLLKDASRQQLLQAIRQVAQGQASLHPQIALRVMRELHQTSNLPPTENPLTDREVETLRLIARGLTNQEIATTLVISEFTVSRHVNSILQKLHLANRTQAALYALRTGLATLDLT
jgi:NarL family two-component system response regulator LiaR